MGAPSKRRVGVCGALGRMGRMIIGGLLAPAAAPPDDGIELTLGAALEASNNPHLGQDIGPLCGAGAIGVALAEEASLPTELSRCQVVIDFSSPHATGRLAAAAAAAGVPLVIGTTGLPAEALQAIDAAARHVAIVRSANMSPGVNVLCGLLQKASRALADYDAEIVEIHHRHKRDAPSGTALLLAEAIQAGRAPAAQEVRTGRQGLVGPRPPAELGVFAVRGGDVVGDHTVLLLGSGERIELVHRATSREVFAQGALRAARWLLSAPRAPGVYDMQDVLGLK
jgi:4-hydroxy-tetrahydrodipicolinate reductase